MIWGIEDKFTPCFGPVGRYFADLSETDPERFQFERVNGGHVLHDDVPETSQPWLEKSLQWVFVPRGTK